MGQTKRGRRSPGGFLLSGLMLPPPPLLLPLAEAESIGLVVVVVVDVIVIGGFLTGADLPNT